MEDGKMPINPNIPNQGLVHGPGGFVYESPYMTPMGGAAAKRPSDLNIPLPRFPHPGQNLVKSEEGVFDTLALHPGLRVQIPSHDQLTNTMPMKLDEGQQLQRIMQHDLDSAPTVKPMRSMPHMRYPAASAYTNAFTPNVVNYGMAPQQHRMPDVAVPQMFRFPPHKDAVNHVFAQLDGEVGHIGAARGMTPMPKPHPVTQSFKGHPPYPSGYASTLEKYRQKLRLKQDSEPSAGTRECNGGIVYDKGPFSQGGRWLVFWDCNGRMWRKSFLVSMYGSDGAKELAERFWVSKMRAMQLYNSIRATSSFDADPKRLAEAQRAGRQNRAGYTSMSGGDSSADLDKHQVPDDPEVIWDDEANCWCFEYLDRATNTLTIKRFPVSNPSMMQDVKKEAIRQRVEHWREIVKAYTESEYCGHTYEKSRTCWRVSHWIPSKGINRNRYFNISKYGYIEAKEKSKMYRLIVHDLGGEEPASFPADNIPPPAFFADPVTKFYHRILNSLRKQERS
ncbi:uncharacterized protein BXIN_2387 [Babesia sp. Xinjiang]|uniref:uncharacterized protein n=1 Tax=Babesia sp. Xinjiang TaxID=462227 RepID=UPI000A25CA8F|nr:uncharacterized protein BXIN_2387 [Babesia sp. Xinjiang]ORM40657.1 hypothetical protein BXIN_2387 [Babesia sp. Xinjiang]